VTTRTTPSKATETTLEVRVSGFGTTPPSRAVRSARSPTSRPQPPSAGLANALAVALGLDGASADRIENTSATGASALHRGVESLRNGDTDVALVDVACIHDAFTVLELIELEELGFYETGTAWEATLDGDTALDGELPVNPGGGLKARGHPLGATGLSQIVELVWQLRGDLPASRRVEGAETGFAINVAGFGNNSVCTVLRA